MTTNAKYLLLASLFAAAPLAAQEAAPTPAPEMTAFAAATPAQAATATVGAPPAGMGQVVFFRPSRLIGAALGCTVHEGDVQQARLGNGKYFAINVAPGTRQYRVESEAKDLLTLEIEPDTVSYVRCSIGMGVMAGRPNLSPADKAEFDKIATKLKPWTPKAGK